MRESDDGDRLQMGPFPPEVILLGVRCYMAYPLSARHVEALMEARGVEVDHSTLNQWVIKYSPRV
jgi:transposase-like protein